MTVKGMAAAGAMVLVAGLGVATGSHSVRVAHADEPMLSADMLRTGWDSNEPALSPAAVTAPGFGLRFSTAVSGEVTAQPLVVGRMVIVATQSDDAYGIDRVTGAIKWMRSFGPAWPTSVIGCHDLVQSGVTGTPVFDPATGTVYLMAKVNDGPKPTAPHWKLHAMDAQTGTERSGYPVVISGAATNSRSRVFNPFTANQRTGLLLTGGEIFAGFASYCDIGPYVGWVAGIKTRTRAVKLWTTEATSSRGEAGVWQSGGGLVSDGPGRIFFSTGNGLAPPVGPGHRPPPTRSESVVHLLVHADGSMNATDFFAPCNAPTLDKNDTDLGSAGPVALPTGPFGTRTHPHLLVQTGKDGRMFLLDRDNLGGRCQGPRKTDSALTISSHNGGVWGHPAVWGGDGGHIYTVPVSAPMRAFKYATTKLTLEGKSSGSFGYTSGSPVVTSTGTTTGSALVWVIYSSGGSGLHGRLQAYDALPGAGALRMRWSAPVGTVSKFSSPATDGGQVFVGTRDGHLLEFGTPTGLRTIPATPSTSPSTPMPQPNTLELTTSPTLGVILTDSAGMTVYQYGPESGGQIKCTGRCLNGWLPLIHKPGDPLQLPISVHGVLNLTTRPDSDLKQVTFDGHPLYLNTTDQQEDDINGNHEPWTTLKYTP